MSPLHRRLLLTTFAAACSFASAGKATAEEPQSLTWKAFAPDAKTFYQELTTVTEQRMRVMGQDVRQTQELTYWASWTPKEMKDGHWIAEQRILGIAMTVTIGGTPAFRWDSRKKDVPDNPVPKVLQGMVSAMFTYHVDPRTMRVTRIDGVAELVKRLKQDHPDSGPALSSLVTADILGGQAEQAWLLLPPRPVRKGDTWSVEHPHGLGPVGTLKARHECVYEGKKDGLDAITVRSTAKFVAPKPDEPNPSFKIKASKEADKPERKGFARFDRERGRFEEVSLEAAFSAILTVELGGQELEITIDQTQKTMVRTFDKNPVE